VCYAGNLDVDLSHRPVLEHEFALASDALSEQWLSKYQDSVTPSQITPEAKPPPPLGTRTEEVGLVAYRTHLKS
jgi:hypothetical protein